MQSEVGLLIPSSERESDVNKNRHKEMLNAEIFMRSRLHNAPRRATNMLCRIRSAGERSWNVRPNLEHHLIAKHIPERRLQSFEHLVKSAEA